MVQQQLDVYRDWLGVTEPARPLNYYQLLRLPQFEDDAAKIRSHYRKLNATVRKYGAGDYLEQSQNLLNELAKAMLCLTDATRKAEYDATLGRKDTGDRRRRTLEELLLGRKVLNQEQLERARRFAKTVNLEIRDAVLQQKLATSEVVMQLFAESIGLPYVDLADFTLEPDLLRQVPATMARAHSCAPLMVDDGRLLVATPNPISPEVEDQLRLRIGHPVRTVLCTPAAINEVVAKYYPKEVAAAEQAAAGAAQSGRKPAPVVSGENQSAAPARPARSPEEQVKYQKNVTIILANFTFLGVMLAATFTGFSNGRFVATLLGALVAAGMAAGVGYLVTRR